jgi:hypothetical protein
MCTLITSKATDIDENIANQNHATRTCTPKPGYLNLSIIRILQHFATKLWNITNFVMLFQAVMKFLSRSKF